MRTKTPLQVTEIAAGFDEPWALDFLPDGRMLVTEKPTGNLQLGAGFSSSEKLSLTFGIRQDNIFGTGNYLGLDINTSKYNRTLAFTSVDPYFTTDGISRTIDVYHRSSKPYEEQGGKTFYRPRDLEQFVRLAGVASRFRASPVMSESFHVFFDSEDDYRRGDEILDAMPAGDTPGRRASVTKYDVAVRMTL